MILGFRPAKLALTALVALASALLLLTQGTSSADAPGKYTYSAKRGTYMDTTVYGGRSWSVYETTTTEQWIASDGSGRQREASGPPSFVSSADRASWEAAGKPTFLAHGFQPHVGDEWLPPGSFDELSHGTGFFERMPRDARSLARFLVGYVEQPAQGGGGGNGFPESVRTLQLVERLLENPLAAPADRLALFEAERLVPGVEALGQATDAAGRSGIAIGAISGNSGIRQSYELIFDVEGSRPLSAQIENLEARAGYPADEVPLLASSTLYLDEGKVGFLRARPHRHRR